MNKEKHLFLLQPGHWLGEGKISFSTIADRLHFYTRWQITQGEEGMMFAKQEVEIVDSYEIVVNNFIVREITETSFKIHLSNQLLGQADGKGLIDADKLAWEFHGQQAFEGFEIYERQQSGDYQLHAEYASEDLYRTIIDAKLWQKLER